MQHHGLVQHNAPMSSTHKLQRQRSFWKKPTRRQLPCNKTDISDDPRTGAKNRHKKPVALRGASPVRRSANLAAAISLKQKDTGTAKHAVKPHGLAGRNEFLTMHWPPGKPSSWTPFWGPNFGPQNGVRHKKILRQGPVLGSRFRTPKRGPTNVSFLRFPALPTSVRSCAWMFPSTLVGTLTHITPPFLGDLLQPPSARTGEATVSATDFWAGFLTPFLGPILGLLFNTATGSLQACQNHAETQVLALL